MSELKAWHVFVPDEWGTLVHAETRGKAKVFVMNEFGVDEYIYLSATRVPKMDNKALTYKNLQEVGWNYFDEDGNPLKEQDYYCECKCSICRER